jgi:hypothetical protein
MGNSSRLAKKQPCQARPRNTRQCPVMVYHRFSAEAPEHYFEIYNEAR